MKLKTIFNDYLDFCSLYRRKGTHEYYRKSFKLLLAVFEELNLQDSEDLTQKAYDNIVRHLKDSTSKKNSKINTSMSDLTTALRYSNVQIHFKQHKLVDDTRHYRSIPNDELSILIKWLKSLNLKHSNNLVWVTYVLLMLDTGARLSEALNIRTTDIDFSSNLIYLETTKTEKRAVPFGDLSKALLKRIFNRKHEFLLWNALRDEPMTKRSLERFLERLNKELSFNSGNVHPHRFRKTFATQLLRKGCPLTTIQRLLGHSDIRTTMIYLDIDIAMLNADYTNHYPY